MRTHGDSSIIEPRAPPIGALETAVTSPSAELTATRAHHAKSSVKSGGALVGEQLVEPVLALAALVLGAALGLALA